MNPLSRLIPYALAVLALVGLGWYLHHSGFESGKAEREAYYAPILKAAQDIASAAEVRLKRQETDSEATVATQEKTHAEAESALQSRAAAAERSYARILQDGAARRPVCPPAPTSPASPEPPRSSGESQCAGPNAALARAIAERAVRDAERYAQCQKFYNDQRDIANR